MLTIFRIFSNDFFASFCKNLYVLLKSLVKSTSWLNLEQNTPPLVLKFLLFPSFCKCNAVQLFWIQSSYRIWSEKCKQMYFLGFWCVNKNTSIPNRLSRASESKARSQADQYVAIRAIKNYSCFLSAMSVELCAIYLLDIGTVMLIKTCTS